MSAPEKPADWNDAYVWPQPGEEVPPDAEEFEVVGEASVDGHAPGERFKAVISDERKALLLGSHLELVNPVAEAKPKDLAEAHTKEELEAMAERLGVSVKSNANKADLAKAIVAHEKAAAEEPVTGDPAEQANPTILPEE